MEIRRELAIPKPIFMSSTDTIGIIGSGPTAIYLLKHVLNRVENGGPAPRSVSVFEKSAHSGMGMPYNPETTDDHNLSNISSEELPELVQTFADWLRDQRGEVLEELGVRDPIDEGEVYPRLALGRYLRAQYLALLDALRQRGVEVHEFPACRVDDLRDDPGGDEVLLVTAEGARHAFARVVIASGHCWPAEDRPHRGYYASPWPIHKVLPEEGTYFNHAVGLLGASLSAFDVASSLAHRHGTFTRTEDGGTTYELHPEAEGFRLVMHSSEGLLPHLQFAQEEPLREIYRHVGRGELLSLVDAQGFLRLERYFDKVCRPVLRKAAVKDRMPDLMTLLDQPTFRLRDFIKKMTAEHDHLDAFDGMEEEMAEARSSVEKDRPVHWKEYVDDLMYTLNFHAELLPAEDHILLKAEVMPFLLNVVAAMPLPSGEALLALHAAGLLKLVKGKVEISEHQPHLDSTRVLVEGKGKEDDKVEDYRLFIDCSGQKPQDMHHHPFTSLARHGRLSQARVRFSDDRNADTLVPEEHRDKVGTDEEGRATYEIGGINIDPEHRIIGADGEPNPRVYEVSFPFVSGLRPYSYGLQACNETARLVVEGMFRKRG